MSSTWSSYFMIEFYWNVLLIFLWFFFLWVINDDGVFGRNSKERIVEIGKHQSHPGLSQHWLSSEFQEPKISTQTLKRVYLLVNRIIFFFNVQLSLINDNVVEFYLLLLGDVNVNSSGFRFSKKHLNEGLTASGLTENICLAFVYLSNGPCLGSSFGTCCILLIVFLDAVFHSADMTWDELLIWNC